MKLSVFGIGYVGCVSAACFAKEGHDVVSVDANPVKVEMVNNGKSPMVEPDIDELISKMVREGRLRAVTDAIKAVRGSEMSLVCVGTPSQPNGSLDPSHIEHVCREIGAGMQAKRERHTVVIRSTILPGTMENVVVPALEASSGRKVGRDIGIAINPEFFREGTSLTDFYAPPFTLIGAEEEDATLVRRLYENVNAPIFVMGIGAAAMVKYACNCFHALKVSFGNEMGNICKALSIDGYEVMDVFCQDRKLNLSPSYLRPGFAFGGSCLPKDLRAITYKAKELDVAVPLLSSVLQSNHLQIERALKMVLLANRCRIGLLGLSFKADTDDLRESPIVTLAKSLIDKGKQLAIYDRQVSLAHLLGANKEYIEREIPHISRLMRSSLKEVLDASDVLIVGNDSEEFRAIESELRQNHLVIDLVRLWRGHTMGRQYDGICW
jgi:GDP-mannose 6-dehydrogenase